MTLSKLISKLRKKKLLSKEMQKMYLKVTIEKT